MSNVINLTPSLWFFALIPWCCVLSREAVSTNFIEFGFTWPGIGRMLDCTRCEHAITIRSLGGFGDLIAIFNRDKEFVSWLDRIIYKQTMTFAFFSTGWKFNCIQILELCLTKLSLVFHTHSVNMAKRRQETNYNHIHMHFCILSFFLMSYPLFKKQIKHFYFAQSNVHMYIIYSTFLFVERSRFV
jgi:hypothetical protein